MKNKILIFTPHRRNLKEALMISEDFQKKDSEILIVCDFYVKEGDSRKEIRTTKFFQDFLNMKLSADLKICRDFINSLESLKINDSVRFQNIVTYDGLSLWRMSLTYLLGQLLPFFKDLRLSREIINFVKPDEVVVLGAPGRLGSIFRTVCFARGINVNFENKNSCPGCVKRCFLNAEYYLKRVLRFIKSLCYEWINFVNRESINMADYSPVVFFNYIERNLDAVLPLIKKFSSAERLVVNMPYSGCEKKLKRENIKYREFLGFHIYKIYDKGEREFLNNIWFSLTKSAGFKSHLEYEGIPLWGLLEETFWYLVFRVFPEQIRNIDTVKKIIKRNKAKCVIVSEYCCEVVLPAKSLAVPTFSVLPTSPEDNNFYGDIIADYVAVSGNCWKDNLISLGADPARVYVVGPAKFDLVHNVKFNKEELFKGLRLDSKLKTICYVGTYPDYGGFYYEDYVYQIRMVYRSLSKVKNVNLITKLHPWVSDFELYRRISGEEGCNMVVIRDYDLWELLYCCDLVISDFSSVSYEAVLMDKMVLLLAYTYKYFESNHRNFEKSQVALYIKDFSELEKKIVEALSDPKTQVKLEEKRREYAINHAWPKDGRTAERMRVVIGRILLEEFKKNKSFVLSGGISGIREGEKLTVNIGEEYVK